MLRSFLLLAAFFGFTGVALGAFAAHGLLLNSLTRSLGQPDAYPFALAGEVLAKLRFVHDVVREAARRPAPVAAPAPQPAPAPKQNVKKNSKTTSKDVR